MNITSLIRRLSSMLSPIGGSVGVGLLLFTACTDWTDHYDEVQGDGAMAGMSLYDQIASRPDLSDFRQVLDSTHVYANNRRTTLYYKDLLAGDQFYTVWAPKNGTFNCDSLLQLCATHDGDSLVGTHFLGNHIARYRHSAGSNERVLMANGKAKHLAGNYMDGALMEQPNMPASNGILHVMKTDYHYNYNIYECLVSLGKYSHIGNFLRMYQMQEFDETNSLPQGIVDGKTIYADSVFVTYNEVLYSLDYIDREDSTFIMFVPTAELWNKIYPEASRYFNYGMVEKADSMQNYWSHYSLIQDLVYNPLWQTSPKDSLTSTTWYKHSYPYHVYYNPYEKGGLMSYVTDSTICSNGVIYEMKEWPFDNNMLYFKKVKKECESTIYENYETSTKNLTLERKSVSADSVSGGYLNVSPTTDTSPYYIVFEVPSVLSGTYDVGIVYLPKTVFDPTLDPNSTKTSVRNQFRPCKFLVDIIYAGADGKEYTVATNKKYRIDPAEPSYYVEDAQGDYIMECNLVDAKDAKKRAFISNRYCVDTVHVATFTFPACNYGQRKCSTRIKITNNVLSGENKASGYSANMLIDQILLIPHNDETKE